MQFKGLLAFTVPFNLIVMYQAINLNNQASGIAIKVSNIAVNDLLAAELNSVQAVGYEVPATASSLLPSSFAAVGERSVACWV